MLVTVDAWLPLKSHEGDGLTTVRHEDLGHLGPLGALAGEWPSEWTGKLSRSLALSRSRFPFVKL